MFTQSLVFHSFSLLIHKMLLYFFIFPKYLMMLHSLSTITNCCWCRIFWQFYNKSLCMESHSSNGNFVEIIVQDAQTGKLLSEWGGRHRQIYGLFDNRRKKVFLVYITTFPPLCVYHGNSINNSSWNLCVAPTLSSNVSISNTFWAGESQTWLQIENIWGALTIIAACIPPTEVIIHS